LTDEAKDEAAKAKEQAGQAGHQAKAAAKSGGRALKHAASDAADEVRDVASDVADKAEDVAQDVAQEAVSVAHRLRIAAPDLTLAAVGLAVTVYACRNAIDRYKAAPEAVAILRDARARRVAV
jgi:hypothetical protein